MKRTLRKMRTVAAQKVLALRHLLFGEPEWIQRKRRVDWEFDSRFKTDTGGFTHLRELEVEFATWRDGTRHIASDPGEFDTAIAALPISPDGRTFIDYGAGKGRAMLLASLYPFAKIVGVEFAGELLAEARQNVFKFSADEQKCTDFEFVHDDVLNYDLPLTPTVIFLYNPFNDEIMDGVAERTLASVRNHPRDLHVVYINAFQINSWFKAGFEEIKKGSNFSILILPASGLIF